MSSARNVAATTISHARHALVGRDRELAEIAALASRSRLLTVWGPGGIGKTAVARAWIGDFLAASRDAAPFDDARFVSLSTARTLGDLCARIADAIAIEAAPKSDADAVRLVARALAARPRMLLVLDNVEQIAADAASALSAFLDAAPQTSFLVTSRELLGIPGETPYELTPLAPADAAQLLVARASALRPSFAADATTLEKIAARVDGLPLALELAAARLSVTTAEDLLARLDDRFGVLRRDHGRSEERQRTMWDAIDWSWNLLDEEERAALASLAVFRGGFDAAAAAAVIDRGERSLDLLLALRHKSLLIAFGEPPRFDLLSAIRDFAAEKLGSRTREAARAHATHYVLNSKADPALDAENLLAVAERAHDRESAELAIRAAVLVAPSSIVRGDAAKIAELLDRALALLPGANGGSIMEARAALGAARFALGRLHDARRAIEGALDLANEPLARARMLNSMGSVQQALGDLKTAEKLTREALAALEHADGASAHSLLGQCLSSLAVIQHVQGHWDDAMQTYARALDLQANDGPVGAVVRTRARLGFLHQDLGDDATALVEYERAKALLPHDAAPSLHGILAGYVGNVKRGARDEAGALASYERAITLTRLAGDRRFEGTFRMDRAIAQILFEQPARAIDDLDAASSLVTEVGDQTLLALILGYAAVAHASAGSIEAARDHATRDHATRARAAAEESSDAARELATLHAAFAAIASGDPTPAKNALARFADAPIRGQHRRIATALLRRALDRLEPPRGAIVVRGSSIEIGGAPIDLAGKASHGAVMLLVAERLRAPGAIVPLAALLEAGWPNEKMAQEAGKNRLRVLVSTLRSAGLDAIKSAKGGYFLDENVPLVKL